MAKEELFCTIGTTKVYRIVSDPPEDNYEIFLIRDAGSRANIARIKRKNRHGVTALSSGPDLRITIRVLTCLYPVGSKDRRIKIQGDLEEIVEIINCQQNHAIRRGDLLGQA